MILMKAKIEYVKDVDGKPGMKNICFKREDGLYQNFLFREGSFDVMKLAYATTVTILMKDKLIIGFITDNGIGIIEST